MTLTADRRKAQIRSLLAKHDPEMLAFVDAVRGQFPQALLTQLELPVEGISMRARPTSPIPWEPKR